MIWLLAAVAASMAFFTPVMFVAVHHEVRLRRIKLIDILSRSFGKTVRPGGALSQIPSFEFVKAKYGVDLGECPKHLDRKTFQDLDFRDPAVEHYITGLHWYNVSTSRHTLMAGVPYAILTAFGLFAVLAPLAESRHVVTDLIPRSILLAGGMESASDIYVGNVLMIAGATFLGAFLFTLRSLLRGVIVFDLSSASLLRAATHIIVSVLGSIIVWRSFVAIGGATGAFGSRGVADPGETPINFSDVWLFLAFMAGYLEDFWLQYALDKAVGIAKFVKQEDRRFTKQSYSIPLDVIDGIDSFTRFRMAESDIYEVQNLAVYNPLMLHVESPFGLYQAIDWVAQAQLCAIAGLERFMLLRQYNIRTIFDLQRAVFDSPQDDTLDSDTDRSPRTTEQLIRFIGSILTMPTDISRQVLAITKSSYNALGAEKRAGLDAVEFTAYLAQLFGEATPPDMQATTKQLVRVMLDDLHVKRLRQIWDTISSHHSDEVKEKAQAGAIEPEARTASLASAGF